MPSETLIPGWGSGKDAQQLIRKPGQAEEVLRVSQGQAENAWWSGALCSTAGRLSDLRQAGSYSVGLSFLLGNVVCNFLFVYFIGLL